MDRADGVFFLDPARRYRLSVDAGDAPSELRVDGQPHPLRAVAEEENCAEGEHCVIVAPASITLQALITLRRRTGHPVVLAEAGRLLGVCGETEIIAALAGRNEGAAAP
jgi:hypothetical protein